MGTTFNAGGGHRRMSVAAVGLFISMNSRDAQDREGDGVEHRDDQRLRCSGSEPAVPAGQTKRPTKGRA